jgi:signal transduction histidine kinase/ligand-binding sensor domain-containing protein/CheY-like chemotaxis protein/AraC-like DNA-binding protein
LKIKYLITLTLFVCFSINQNYAQENTFYHYGLDQGLSQQTIRCILKDSNGFLWLGTQDGLNRFDGNSFRVFRKKESDTLTISGKFINDIVEGEDGTIWIATANNGVCYYNPKTDVFTRTDFNSGNCTSLTKDTYGNIYAASLNKGLYVFIKEADNYRIITTPTINNKNELISSLTVKNSHLYIGTTDGVLLRGSIKEDSLHEFIKFKITQPLGIINEILYQDQEILLGTSNGLFKYFPQTQECINLNLKQYDNQITENLVVESIAIKDQILYVGTDNGLFILKNYDSHLNKYNNTVVYKGDKDNINSITSNRVYDILLDNDLLWIGTNNLDVASLNPPVFKTINTFSQPAINNNYVFSILKTKDYLFIGTRDGLNCIDNNDKVYLITRENTNQNLAYNVIRAMAVDGENNLWLGTTKGVSIIELNNFNPLEPKIISLFSNDEDVKSLSDNKTRGVYVDHNDKIWITTYGGGINRFTGNLEQGSYSFERFTFSSNKNSISSNFTFNITQDTEHNYWITSDNGLNKLEFKSDDYKNPFFTIFTNNKNDPTTLQSNTTLHTYHDKEGVLWVATQNGLHKFNKNDSTFMQYNESHGLSNTYVYGILEDDEQQLWVSTNSGVYRFDKKRERFTNFSLKDGLQSTEFNLGAHYNDLKNKQLYFGGINGFNVFNPDMINLLDVQGEIVFTELRIKDTLINPITHPENLKLSFTNSKTVNLNWNDFPCTIKFSDLNLSSQKNANFIYRLNESDWNAVNESREIQLLDLPKGTHTIAIQGMSRDRIWTTKPLELKINVNPPWYKSNLAYLMYLLIFFAIIYQFYRMSLRQQLAGQEAKRLKELDDLKSRFITNITHEFRTPLTIIMGYVANLKNVLSDNPNSKTALKSIERNSNNLLSLVNQMLDLAKLEQGQLKVDASQQDIVSFTNYLVNSFTSLANSKKVKLVFNSNEDSLVMDFDEEKWRQVITNLISNAIKFTNDETEVTVQMSKINNNKMSIVISDQGIGIPKADLPFIFDRFYQATNNSNQKMSGTGIGLALTKELIELMHGQITVESIAESGTTFTILMPIYQNTKIQDTKKPRNLIASESFDLEALSNNSSSLDTYNVLIVEDNEEIAHYIGSCLAQNYQLEFAANGEEGLALAETKIPDIIITDVMMPIMDGFQMTNDLQKNTITNHIPIIMLTAKAMQEDKLTGIKSGADVYLTKPFEKEELILRIETLVAKRKQLQNKYATKKLISLDKSNIKADKNLEFLEKAIQFIYQNIEDPEYNSSRLASDLYMSDSQLYRKLKAITNKSTAIFIRSVRLEKAKDLLISTTLSISEIAYVTGFNNPNWFGKAFKEEFGKNPSEYRS